MRVRATDCEVLWIAIRHNRVSIIVFVVAKISSIH